MSVPLVADPDNSLESLHCDHLALAFHSRLFDIASVQFLRCGCSIAHRVPDVDDVAKIDHSLLGGH